MSVKTDKHINSICFNQEKLLYMNVQLLRLQKGPHRPAEGFLGTPSETIFVPARSKRPIWRFSFSVDNFF